MRKFLLISFQIFLTVSLLAQASAGYYSAAEGKTEAALKTQLSSIISSGYKDQGYDGLWNVYKTSDNTAEGKVWDMYSTCTWTHGQKLCGNYSAVCDCINREHSIPQSWFGSSRPMVSDAFHVYPTDGKVNGQRSNFPFGECSGGTTLSGGKGRLGNSTFSGYSGTVFEPADEYKGDFARTYFYFATRYQDKMTSIGGESFNGTTYPSFTAWSQALFLKWHRQDPVSQKEIDRNNAIEAFQKNRNPFIDYPELAEFIWGNNKGQAWMPGGGSYPAVTSPASGTVVDFGDIAYQNTASTVLPIVGTNLTGDLNFAITGSNAAQFSLSTNTVTRAQAEAGYNLTIYYSAQTVGVHNATLTITGGGITALQVALKATSSDAFLAMPATNILSNGFMANWTLSADANDYSLNVYSYTGSVAAPAQTLLEEEFSSPLAASWTSSGYASTTDEPGFIKLASGSNPGVITTPVINMTQPTNLMVKAKKYGSDSNPVLTVKVNNEQVAAFTTTAENLTFTVDIPAKTASSKIEFSAVTNKRIYLDYVKLATAGIASTPTSVSGYPRMVGNVLSYSVSGLESDSTYYYAVTPQGNSAAVSNEVKVKTLPVSTATPDTNISGIIWQRSEAGLVVRNLPENVEVTLTDMLGKKIMYNRSTAGDLVLTNLNKGVYLMQVRINQTVKTWKVLY